MQDYVSLANTSTSSVSSGSTSITVSVLYGGGLSSTQSAGPVAEALPSLISIGRSLLLLPKKLVQQIKAGEFIDFAELPPAKGRQIMPANYNAQIFLCICRTLVSSASSYQITSLGHSALPFLWQYLVWITPSYPMQS